MSFPASNVSDPAYHNTSSVPTSATTTSATHPSKLDGAKATAHATVEHGKASMNQLGNHPKMMKCSNCASDMSIPPSVWVWTCGKGHTNTVDSRECSTTGCNAPKPHGVTWPALLCSKCGTITSVPGSEGTAVVRDATAALKAGIHSLTDPPATFHCEHCQTVLVTPIGAWVCQTCNTNNQPTATICTRCSHSKAQQRVLCAHCHKSTSVPANGLTDTVSSGLNSLVKMARGAILDITGKPHVDCPTCKHPVELPKSVVVHSSNPAASTSVAAPHTASVAGLSQPTSQGIPVHESAIALTCSNCSHHFTLGGGPMNVPAPVDSLNGVPAHVLDMPVAPIADSSMKTSSGATVTTTL